MKVGNRSQSLRKMCPNTKFFLIQQKLGPEKYGPEKIPYLDTFQAVNVTTSKL